VRTGSKWKEVEEFVSHYGMKVNYGSMPTLGATIGFHPEKDSIFAVNAVKDQQKMFTALSTLPSQICYRLIRICGIPSMNYHSRVIPPNTLKAAAALFDQMVIETMQTNLSLPSNLSASTIEQLQSPIKDGGLGLRSFSLLSPVAYLASASQALRDLPPIINRSGPQQMAMQSTHSHLVSSKIDESLVPNKFADYCLFYTHNPPKDLQKKLSKHVQSSRTSQQNSLPINIARRLSAKQQYASRWLTVSPSLLNSRMNNNHFQFAIRNLLNLPIQDYMPYRCSAGCNKTISSDHFQSCLLYRNIITSQRHNIIIDRLASLCRLYNIPFLKEPPIGVNGDRADLLIMGGYGPDIYLDVSVTHPATNAFIKSLRTHINPLSATKKREQAKAKKYTSQLPPSSVFFPFVMESYGAIGAKAISALRAIDKEARALDPTSSFFQEAVTTVSVALQMGNAMMMSSYRRLVYHNTKPSH
jgi:hypothetical protein